VFGPDDRLGARPSAIVNESFARKHLGDNPLGQTFQFDTPGAEAQLAYHVIGLVKDTKYLDVREDFTPIAYLSTAQGTEVSPFLDLVLRSDLPAASLTPSVTRAVREVLPGTTVAYDSIETYVRDSLVTERLMATLSGFFGALAMLIASVGLYGVMSYLVNRRKVEIGIRMALGADPRTVIGMMLRESAILLVWGVVIGTVLAAFATRWATTLLYELTPWDPASFALGVVGLGLVSLLAAWLPARRAARLAPTIALQDN
jgi:ABC-type antimicrobial peptide transport system permease subunit